MIKRLWAHLTTTRGTLMRQFSAEDMRRITAAVTAGEARHAGQIVVALEASLPLEAVIDGVTAHARAGAVFRQLNVWDTQHNTGILLYLLLADREIEIVADRGIHATAGAERWQAICQQLEADLRAGKRADAVIAAVERLADTLATHSSAARTANELPDGAVLL